MSTQQLLTIYELFTSWAENFTFACQKGCSTCCTQSVSMTTLEGELIYDYIMAEKPEFIEMLGKLPESLLNPITTNQFAAACLRKEMPEVEAGTWNMTPCVFLQNDCCAIYPVRSFMCRSLGSSVSCAESGEAVMDPLFLTLNTLILQCIEHLDQGRPWGNMFTILTMIAEDRKESGHLEGHNFRISQPIPGFLVPPEEQAVIEKQLQTLVQIINRA